MAAAVTGRIPLYRGAAPVGVVEWAGSAAAGAWRARWTDADADTRAAFALIVERRGDLARRWFAGRGDRAWRGWRGFAGVLGALEAALPAVGLRVDRRGLVWPSTAPVPPRGADLAAWTAEHAADAAADAAIRAEAVDLYRSRRG